MQQSSKNTQPKPTKELLELARRKASGLQDGQQIRLTADELSWWVMKDAVGLSYIGYYYKDGVTQKFFKNRSEYPYFDIKLNEETGKFQRLM